MNKLFTIIILLTAQTVFSQDYDTNGVQVETFAGSGFVGWVDGVGEQTMFNVPSAIACDSSNNLFVFDTYNKRIRKISTNATVTTFCGGGSGTGDSCGVDAPLPEGQQMLIDKNNVLWASVSTEILEITPQACEETYYDFAGPFSPLPTRVCTIGGMCVDSQSNFYFSDQCGQKIYKYAIPGPVTVFAGSGNTGLEDGKGIFTSFNQPMSLTADGAGNIYVWDSGNGEIRKIDQAQNVTTLAGRFNNRTDTDGIGTNATFGTVNAMCFDSRGILILACVLSVREMTMDGRVRTIAGNFKNGGFADGAGSAAIFGNASGVCLSQGSIFVTDSNNQRIRQITFNSQPQIVPASSLTIAAYSGVTISGAVGRTYQIQTSDDMTSWSTVSTLVLSSNPYLWIDQNPISGNKFYQAVLLP